MRALVPFAAVAGVLLGAVRLWLQVKQPTPRSFRGRVVRVAMDVVLVVFAVVVVIVLLVVLAGVVAEVAGNVT